MPIKKGNSMKRTDLAVELTTAEEQKGVSLIDAEYEGIKVTEVTVGRQGAALIGKPAGRYVTLHCENQDKYRCALALAHYLEEMLKPVAKWEQVLVAGLGNESITPDSLGAKTVRRIPATAHLSQTEEFAQLGLRPVVVLETDVMAKTGLESTDRLKYIAKSILPAAIIAVDSLACADNSRLCTTIQLTDTGIAPGSGVGGSRKPLNSAIMGTRVIAVGVPTVIDLDSITDEAEGGMMVTPRDIDVIIRRYSEIISLGINSALNPTLSPSEIEQLLF